MSDSNGISRWADGFMGRLEESFVWAADQADGALVSPNSRAFFNLLRYA